MHPGHQVMIDAPNASLGGGLVYCCECQAVLPLGEAYVVNFEDRDIVTNTMVEQRTFFACSRDHANGGDQDDLDRALVAMRAVLTSTAGQCTN